MLQNDRCRKRGETTKKHHTNIDLHNYHWVVDEFDINSWDHPEGNCPRHIEYWKNQRWPDPHVRKFEEDTSNSPRYPR